ncbi:MAG: type I methionyl aminopeptidase [Planctomycetota bacterium]
MIHLKTARQVRLMERAGRIVAEALLEVRGMIALSVTTAALNARVDEVIRKNGGVPLFLGYRGFPASACISVNEEVVHGIPGPRELVRGDLVSVDVGVRRKGWCADAAWTFPVGEVSERDRALLAVGREALSDAIAKARAGLALAELCGAIQSRAERNGFSVVRKYTGHGIGREMHEEPQVPNFVDGGILRAGTKLEVGMVLAIEPMVNAGGGDVETLSDGWTVVTRDRLTSVHFEHTVAVTEDGARVLTDFGEG